MRRSCLLLIILSLLISVPLWASNCAGTSVGFVPLNDLGAGVYHGYQGGLYAGGSNAPPPAHFSAGLHEAMQITKLNSSGNPDPAGKIVLISIGMSNTTQEFSFFKPIADADPRKNPDLVIVDCAQGGKTAPIWADPANAVWTTADQRLQAAGVSPNQVQVVWSKQAISGPNKAFPADAQELQGYLKTIAQNVKAHYPNARIIYHSSRIYAGYASTTLNPEPYAYQAGFSMKWVIQEQIDGLAALNFDPAKGTVRAPWLGWGPYLWADGLNPRSDGLTYVCADFNTSDGTHPATGARQKVTNLLLGFLKNDKTAAPWFTRDAYQPSSVSQSKLSADGNAVALTAMAVTMGSGVEPGAIYVEDTNRSCGIRVVTGATVAEGSFVNVTGVLQTSSDGERYLDASKVALATEGTFPDPVALTNRELGGGDAGVPPLGQKGVAASSLNNVGLLVTTWGRVTPINASTFSIDDGSAVGVRVTVPAVVSVPSRDAYVKVTGISSLWKDTGGNLHRLIKVRRQTDITVIQP